MKGAGEKRAEVERLLPEAGGRLSEIEKRLSGTERLAPKTEGRVPKRGRPLLGTEELLPEVKKQTLGAGHLASSAEGRPLEAEGSRRQPVRKALGMGAAVMLGGLLGVLAFFGVAVGRIRGRGYQWEDALVALDYGVQREVAGREYSRMVDEVLSSAEFVVGNLAEYYEIEWVEGAEGLAEATDVGDLTEAIDDSTDLTEVADATNGAAGSSGAKSSDGSESLARSMGSADAAAGLVRRVNRLLELGYRAEEINLVNRKLGEEAVAWVLERDYWAELKALLELEYFREENLARYWAWAAGKVGLAKEIGLTGEVDSAEADPGAEVDWVEPGSGEVDSGGETDSAEEVDLARAEETVTEVNIGLDLTPYEDAEEVTEFGEEMVVNKYHHLGAELVPPELTAVRKDCVKGNKLERLSRVAQEAFEEMCLAARAEGLRLVANSAYRGYAEQEAVLRDSERQFGAEYAAAYVSRPGFSEHQTGLALDVAAAQTEVFKGTAEHRWTLENAARFGFILRYPEGKERLTGYAAEAWHLRYVGRELAQDLTTRGWTLEEYAARR